MLKILVPVNESESSEHAINYLVQILRRYLEPAEVHLLNVQQPLHGEVGRFLDHDQINDFHRDNGLKELSTARNRLESEGIAHQYHIGVGNPAEVIVEYAADKQCDEILMGTSARGAFAAFFMGSVAASVIQLSPVPVMLVK